MRRSLTGLAVMLFALNGAEASTLIGVDPVTVELAVAPGGKGKGALMLSNPFDRPMTIDVEIADGWAQETRRSTLPPAEWLTVKVPARFVLRPKGRRRVKYRVRVPPDFRGETMAYIFFRTPPEEVPGRPLNIRWGQGIPIYLAARGTEEAELVLNKAFVSFRDERRLEFGLDIGLKGNAHVRPRGEVVVFNPDGLEMDRFEMGYGAPIFPGRSKQFFAKSGRSAWVDGRYTAEINVTYSFLGGGVASLTERLGFIVDGETARILPAEGEPAPAR